MKTARFVQAGTVIALVAGATFAAWCWRASVDWRHRVPWPAHAMTPDRPCTGPLRAAYEEALPWPVQREQVERLARLYLANGFNTEAGALLPGIISRRPEAPEWVHRHAVLLAGEGRLPEAVALWQSIRSKTNAQLPVRVKLADALVKLNRETEAVQIYHELLAAKPGYPYAWYGLVSLDLKHQRWVEAREKLRSALAAAPDFYGHHALLESVARHFGDEAGAAEADRHVKRLGRFRDVPDSWVEPAVADCYDPYRLRVDADRLRSETEAIGGDTGLTGALERIERAIALAPRDAMNYQFLATIQGIRGDEAAAARAYERCLELEPRGVTAYLRYSNLLIRQGKSEAARALLTRGALRCPDDADIASALGDNCAAAGAWPEAAEAYLRLVALRPDLPDIAPKAAMASFRSGAVEAGLKILRENLRRHPRHEQTLGYLLMDALRRGDAQEARDLVRRLEAVAPAAPATKEMQRLVGTRFGETP